jgi:hypothetical protein
VRGFAFVTGDDLDLIAGNPVVTAWASAPLKERLLTTAYGYAIPVTAASFALDWRIGGGRPGAFHLTNLALHLLTALLLFFVARRWLHPLAALLAAALFLLHPVQAEAASYVTQRKDLLATLFALAALHQILAARAAATTRGLWTAAVLVALAVLSKPSTLLIAPALAAIYALRCAAPGVPAARWSARTAVPLGLLCLLPAPFLLLNLHVHSLVPTALVDAPAAHLGRAHYVAAAMEYYTRALLVPLELAPKVLTPVEGVGAGAFVNLAAVAALFVAALVVGIRKRNAHALAFLAWIAAAYLPVSNLIPLRRHAADSLLYLLMPALCAAAGVGIVRLARAQLARGRQMLFALAGAVLVAAAVLAHRQAAVWRDQGTRSAYLYGLYPQQREAVEAYVAHLTASGQRARAQRVWQRYLEEALAQQPTSLRARHHLMRLYLEQGQPQRAWAVIEQTPRAARDTPAFWEAQLEWAMRQRDERRALQAALELVRRDPASPHRALLERLRARAGAAGPSARP